VVLLVGERCGTFPTDGHAAALGDVPVLEKYCAASGQARASYTQWEFLLAKHYDRKIYVFFTDTGFTPDEPNSEGLDLHACQQAYRNWIKQTGKHRDPLTTPAKLIEDVLVLPFPDLGRPKPIALPYPSLGTLFKGREAFLKELRQSLTRATEGHATAIVGKALHGLGGVGKTRLAVEYAWQYQDEYSALLFVLADTPENLRRNLAALVGPLVLDLPEQDATEEEVRLAAALRWLQEHPGWFLILDNVDTREAAAAAEDLFARLHGGQVLITSRLTQWSASVEPLELDVLEPQDAAQFLLERTARSRRKLPSDAADAAELAHELDGLALALEQAGAYIVVKRHLSFADYLRAWRAHVPEVQAWHDERLMKYPRSLAITWQTTLDQLSAGEIALLRLLAWFAPDPVPLFVLEGEQAEACWREGIALLQQESPPLADTAGALPDALATLANYSLLRWDTEAQTVSVHRVVQEILRTRLPEAQRKDWLALCLRLLDQAAPATPSDVRTWLRWDPLRPHVAIGVAQADAAGILELTAQLMNQLGMLLNTKALHAEAEPLMRRALTLDEAAYGPEHPDVARDLNNLAQLLKATHRLAEAEPLSRRMVGIFLDVTRRTGHEHPHLRMVLANYASILEAMGRSEAEIEMQLRALLAEYGLKLE
jgi:tetratricopeptide repeat protein/NB-ARC domain-containing protein